ncbi:MAG: type III restriction endonuclease subunit R [Acidobacteria bacterium]|nr:MAG: type III restriction endonuclease subunit R [Acidobacteriota bacterium]
MLRELKLKAVYRTESDNLLEDFYIPALSTSVRYDRAVGFFSASMLSIAAQGLSAFVQSDGKMRLIFGGELLAEEADAIQTGYNLKSVVQRLGAQFLSQIDNLADALCYRRLEALAWLVANGNLEIKVALKQKGMYHEKIGILTDCRDDSVIFQGSANETTSALLPDFNFESINVFPSWREELRDHFEPYVLGFQQLWDGQSKNTVVIPFPEAVRDRLIKISKTISVPSIALEIALQQRLLKPDDEPTAAEPFVPTIFGDAEFRLKDHQLNALNQWRAQGCQGILALATGAGKTITALYGAVRLFQYTHRMFLVIAVPYQNLADQWVREAKSFGIRAIPCYGGATRWTEDLSRAVHLFETYASPFACAVVVNRTLKSEAFQNVLKQLPGESLMFVGDECHHHHSRSMSEALPSQASVRLGLSATPEPYRGGDEADLSVAYYGPIADRYELADALRDGVLTPYEYHVHLIELTAEETEVYEELSAQISRLAASLDSQNEAQHQQLDTLLFKRSRLLGSASNKLARLADIMCGRPPEPLTLFYCGDGSVEDEDSGESLRQVEATCKLLYKNGWRVATFTAQESRKEREQILANFRVGVMDAMVAIRCLDEGIDVPACRTAYILASSRNPRQFIQRRGRILRRSPGKLRAVIHDMVVVIPEGVCSSFDLEKRLFREELRRVSEFARLAANGADTYRVLEPLLKRYDLLHHFV